MRVLMVPHLQHFRSEESGIKRVVDAYFRYLPQFGIELVGPGQSYDLKATHAGMAGADCDVAHLHGLYWTADYSAAHWEWKANQSVIASIRAAKQVTVPSRWVAEVLQRDMRFTPHVIGHGIEWDAWQHTTPNGGYVLWNKNRTGDVCNPAPMAELARRFPHVPFVSTFAPEPAANVTAIGVVPHEEMKRWVQGATVYLATTKETFGIGILEAMAAGVPVLGFRHGGVCDLVQHGVNGYLAEPGNDEDLEAGLAYCLKHRAVLGANGRDLARAHTWERVAEQVAGVYRLALTDEPPTVSVVIPCYNYAGSVGRAIRSARDQSYPLLTEIIVVDDGSDDMHAVEEAVQEAAGEDVRVLCLHRPNGGVAAARNTGISYATGTYICCLDADDAIEPHFLEVCIDALERDRTLGIAYTGLRWIKPDGSTGLSEWPGEFDYDAQLARRNQIPTCCVFRREMWARLGGYRQRYAPGGAGAEDAEFWLRAGAYGWGATKATDKGLFVYSWGSGRVSGSCDYREVDWLAWHPWTRDGQHPFASVATPAKYAHPVRQYDQPVVSVVIPVGPGHEADVWNALDSLEAQTFRTWEAIVVWDAGTEVPADPTRAYPYACWIPTEGGRGAGHARNRGAEIARGAFLLFLDADDWLYPEFLAKTLAAWEQHEAAVYTDYVGKAHVTRVDELAADLRRHVRHHDGREAVIGYRAADYDCERALRQPETPPFIWCNITTLHPTAWHREVGGFDEGMPSWEDVDYWWRLAWAGKCFVRVPEELMVYRFYSGTRRDEGWRRRDSLVEYIRAKYEGTETMGCRKCGSQPSAPPPAATSRASRSLGVQMSDESFVMVTYKHPNRGQHPVTGAITKTRYGYRAGGDQFLVHRDDIAAQPHLFEAVPQRVVSKVVPVAPVAPVPIAAPQPVKAPALAPARLDLQRLPGVNAEMAAGLEALGWTSAEAILAAGVAGLQGVRGIGPARAQMIVAAIEAMGDGD